MGYVFHTALSRAWALLFGHQGDLDTLDEFLGLSSSGMG